MKYFVAMRWAVGGLLLAACAKEQTFVAPLPLQTDYYPVAVGNVRIYAVADSSWVVTVPSVVNYEVRETVTGTYADAAGQPVFQIQRATRPTASSPWTNDSVFSVRLNNQTVVLNRANRPSVELIFPVREGRTWNYSAYGAGPADTLSDTTRAYRRVGKPFVTAAVPNGAARTYDRTLTTTDIGLAEDDNLYNLKTYEQVFAQGVGPVFRRRRRYNYTDGNGASTPVPGVIYSGQARIETLIDFKP